MHSLLLSPRIGHAFPFLVTLGLMMLAPTAFPADVSLEVSPKALTPLASPWADYFGTHYARTSEEAGKTWNTVRSFGSPHFGIQEENPSAPARKGPFTGRDVHLMLDDFQSPRGDVTATQLLPQLIEHEFTAIYLISSIVRPTLEPFDKDRAYWAVRQVHEAFPEVAPFLVWQMGNEVVSGHFDPKGVWNRNERGETGGKRPPGQKEDNFFGYDLDWKEDYYVNDYLAPAIEATERASQDVYKDPRKIQVALGSMNPYNRQNLQFLASVMNRSFDGRQAPTLKGEPVWKHIDYLTVHYMTGSDRTIETLQRYHDEYLQSGKIQGLWITEDHGHAGKGPVTILERGLRFLDWAARNELNAQQTRLCWWGEGAADPGGQGKDATRLLGAFLEDRSLHFSRQRIGTAGNVYLITDANDADLSRGLVAVVPNRSGVIDCQDLTITLPPNTAAKPWAARAISYSATEPAQKADVTLTRQGDAISLSLDSQISGAWLLMFADSPEALSTP